MVTISLALSIADNQVFAEETLGYMMAEDVSAHLTFNFRDGIETHEFPVFETTNFVANQGTSFRVHGVINDAPHLHKALDEAYKFRLDSAGADYPYRYFDIEVEFTHALGEFDVHHLVYSGSGGEDSLIPSDTKPRKILYYQDCQVSDYLIDTVYNSYRSYGNVETGFAILETIDFVCGGVQSDITIQDDHAYKTEPGTIREFPKLEYNYADDIRTFVTFEFDNGIEKIEFPIFHLISGFAEDDNPSFHVEGVVNQYPLLSTAIDNARDNRYIPRGSNVDFNAKVEFVQERFWGDKLIRGINYEDCNVVGSDITTYWDNEEGFVFVGGFGILQTMDFDCAGMDTINPEYSQSLGSNEQLRNYNMASGPQAIAEFRFHDNTVETINFPIFRQPNFLSQSETVFQLEGMVGNYPLLYKQVDDAAKINQMTGQTQAHNLFDVDVNLQYDNEIVRGFSYYDCRVTNYQINTEQQNEEGFWVGFAQENTFEFECRGYKPIIPDKDTILDTSINDKTSSWAGHTFDGYLQAEDVSTNITFAFRDGVETHEFPVFKSTSDYAENRGLSFQVQGVIADTPHLHNAMDAAYKYRLAEVGGYDYNYKFFDVEVSAITADSTRKTFYYKDCQIADYQIDTLSHSHRGYLSTSTGFAIVNTIDFECAGAESEVVLQSDLTYRTEPGTIRELPKLEYKNADNIRTVVMFEFDNGVEQIQFPIFRTISGFAENDEPSFHVEGIVNRYPLLASAIDNARDNRVLPVGTNVDFDVIAAFLQETPEGDKFLRGIYYKECRVIGSDITTYYDNEEPYAAVGGFAVNQSVDFDCAGMIPLNPNYDKSMKTNEITREDYLMASGINAIAEFRFHDNTIEIIDFPIFEHQGIFTQSNPTFLLAGIVGEYPLLYQQVDITEKINQNVGGLKIAHKPFDVDVKLMYNEKPIREFFYKNCLITDYIVDTPAVAGKEESFFFWFALENTFEFECSGYEPKNPPYDTMSKQEKSEQNLNKYWPDTQGWSDEFRYIPRDKSN
jgi:hypothetical protein